MRRAINCLIVLAIASSMVVSVANAQQEPVELDVLLYGRIGNIARNEVRLENFRQKYPWIKVNVELYSGTLHEFDSYLKVWFAAGQAPDLVCLNFEPLEHAMNGMLLPLNEFIDKDKEFQEWEYWSSRQLEEFTYGGRIYALPQGPMTYGMWFNTDLFAEAGVKYPKLGWTVDDFLEYAQKLTRDWDGDGNPDQYGFDHWGFGHQDLVAWYPIQLGASLWTFDEETGLVNGSNLEDPRVIEGLQFHADLITKYGVSPNPELGFDLQGAGITFPLGRFGMTFGATWSVEKYRAEVGDRFGFQFVPNPKVTPEATALSMVLLRPSGAITSSSEHPEEAWLFLKNQGGYEQEKLIFENVLEYPLESNPGFKNSLILDEWLVQDPPGRTSMEQLVKVIEEGFVWWSPENKFPLGYEEWLSIFAQAMDPVVRGQKTVQQAVDEVFETVNAPLVWDEEFQKRIDRFLAE